MIGGRYQLRAAIGNGGMGTVWQAADSLLRRDVAVKEVLLPPGMAPADRTAMYERTLREARAAAALSHPSVVQVYDVVTEGGRPWIVMELLHARSLADMIIGDGPLAPRAVAKIGVALLGALEVAHGAGVLHRDVKPANVLICTDGRCVLTDFGVARMPSESNLTTPGMVLGSPHFISPERAVGGAFGPPSDLFSLGVSLFTAVEGRPPFDKGDPFETMRAVVEEPPVRPVRAGALVPVLFGLLEKDPARRWDVPTARGALRDLLAGPLANSASHHVTDPYAVVPPTPTAPPQLVAPPSGQIGGRAMLAPGELPTDRRARQHTPSQPAPGAADPGLTATNPARPALPAPAWSPQPVTNDATSPGYSPYPPAGQPGPVFGAPSGLSGGAKGLLARFGRLPKVARLGIAGGVAAVVLLATLGAAGVFSDDAKPRATPSAAPPSPTGPPFPVQVHQDPRGFTLELPAAWTKNAAKGASYIDFTDPSDGVRRVRVNVEQAGGTPTAFLQAAERNLQDVRRCTAPYQRIELRDGPDIKLARRPAAELEYTCGEGTEMRHGIWRVTVAGGKGYEFYLSVPDSRFAESKAIYDHAVASYTLNVAS
jgi:eukaryotic-like serine/threonine-protein kinase